MDVDHSDDDWLEGAHDGQQQTAADKEWGQLEEKFSNVCGLPSSLASLLPRQDSRR